MPESKFVQASMMLLQETAQGEGEIPVEFEDTVIPIAWAEDISGRSKRAEPIRIDLKPRSALVRFAAISLKIRSQNWVSPFYMDIFRIWGVEGV